MKDGVEALTQNGGCEVHHLDGDWDVAAVVLSNPLNCSGSVTEGLRLADQARQRADQINDTWVGSNVAWCGATSYL